MKERLYLRGKIYWCWYYDSQRKLIRETTTCTDRSAARAVLRRREQEAQGAAPQRKSYVSLGDVLTALETWVEGNTTPENTHFVKAKGPSMNKSIGNVAPGIDSVRAV